MPRRTPWLALAGTAVVAAYRRRGRRAGRPNAARWTPPGGVERDGPLPARVVGDGTIRVALLHGLFNAGTYWGGAYDDVADPGAAIVPDLLGFGRAAKPDSGYTTDAHADAVAATLRGAGVVAPVVVGAHSVGSLVALRLAVRHPDLVAGIVAIAPPLYPSRDAARRQIAESDPLARLLVLNEGIGRRLCDLMCRFPRAAETLVRVARPDLPAPLAADRVRHSWASYHETLASLVLAAEAATWLDSTTIPVTIIAGDRDRAVNLPFLGRLDTLHPNVSLRTIGAAGHDLPLTHAPSCIDAIRELATPDAGSATPRVGPSDGPQ